MQKTPNKKPGPQTVLYYRGDGLGIPGLPHEVTREQAQALGLINQLEAALKSGVYQSQEPVSTETPANPEQEA